jgi:hypothetical protein
MCIKICRWNIFGGVPALLATIGVPALLATIYRCVYIYAYIYIIIIIYYYYCYYLLLLIIIYIYIIDDIMMGQEVAFKAFKHSDTLVDVVG